MAIAGVPHLELTETLNVRASASLSAVPDTWTVKVSSTRPASALLELGRLPPRGVWDAKPVSSWRPA
jgi:hypothetical protein